MQYLLLICGDESAAAHAEEGCGGWTEEMTERGLLRATGGLRPPAEARTSRRTSMQPPAAAAVRPGPLTRRNG